MAQLYPGYECEQVTIVTSHIPDTIIAFGQICHNIVSELRELNVCEQFVSIAKSLEHTICMEPGMFSETR
jgi:hypothetical protein